MSTFLEKITTDKKKEVQKLYEEIGLEKIKEKAKQENRQGVFKQALAVNGLSIIAEVKKASPSKGLIYDNFNPTEIAIEFKEKGAHALSVLTEVNYFLGDPSYIQKIKEKVDLPILRKDFIIDPIQIYESKILGADAILLIKALLTSQECRDYIQIAKELSLDVLVEIHNQEELEALRGIDIDLLGINNRDLKSFKTDPMLAIDLKPRMSALFPDAILVAESGYTRREQLTLLEEKEFQAVLIGEGLSRNKALLS